jgi:hypothetical protein
MANEGLAAGIANDDAAGFGNDGAAAFLGFVPRAAEIFQPLRPLGCGAGRNRRQGLGRPWRGRKRRGDRWRRVTR